MTRKRLPRIRSLWMQELLESRRLLAVDINPFKDINDQPVDVSLSPRNFTRVGPHVYFTATTYLHGTELWRTDGTAAGTSLVLDIRPGPESSDISNLTNVNGTLYFTANDGTTGRELWRSEGTPFSTRNVFDLNPGPFSSGLNSFMAIGDLLYFSGSNQQLWVTNGSTTGTLLVKNIFGDVSSLTNVNGTLYFLAGTSSGRAIYSAKGDLGISQSFLTSIWHTAVDVNGALYYSTATSQHRFDPNSLFGPILLDLDANVKQMFNVNGVLYFIRRNNSNSADELLQSDGVGGTTLVASFDSINSLVNIGSTLYFSATTTLHGTELWKSDGTSSGTGLVNNIAFGSTSSDPIDLTVIGSTLYFRANDGTNGSELWKTDGTVAGTVMVKDITPGNGSTPSTSGNTGTMMALGNRLVFSPDFADLWISDGTSDGTLRIGAPFQRGGSSDVSRFVKANNLYFFSATSVAGNELWVTDGTPDGTRLVKDINPGVASSSPTQITAVGGQVFFRANDGASGYELWKSDGTTSGTLRVANLATGTLSSFPSYLTNVNGTLYFTANDLSRGNELWKSDGSTAGTSIVKEIIAGADSTAPRRLTNHNGTLFFAARFNNNEHNLWRSDGTDAGTIPLQTTASNVNGRTPSWLTSLGSQLLFVDSRNNRGHELWTSDGTVAGTALLKDINASGSSFPANLTLVGNKVFFEADDGVNGTELWVTDGTATGTNLVKDFIAGAPSLIPRALVEVNGWLAVSARDIQGKNYLLRSDGTSAGTTLLSNKSVTSMANVNGQLTMVVEDLGQPPRLWKSDGTVAGTQVITTLSGQSTELSPATSFTWIEDQVFFTSRTQARGDELVALSAIDMGDAATQTLSSQDGARHATLGPRLGLLRDASEADGQPSHLGLGDDQAGGDDEDGLPQNLVLPIGSATAVAVQVSNAEATTRLNGWIDWNQDGDWDDAGEKVVSNAAVTSGANSFNITPPAGAKSGLANVRWRIANEANLGPTGMAFSGEVEDTTWQVGDGTIVQLPSSTANSILIRRNGNNLQVIDVTTSNALVNLPLASVSSLQIVGSDTQSDTIHLDFGAGGFFALPGGIDLSGLSGGVDQLKVTGVADGTVTHTAPAARGGLPQFTFKSGTQSIELRYSAFEEIDVTQWQNFSASNRFDMGAATWRITTTDPVLLSTDTRLGGGTLIADRVNMPTEGTLTGNGTIAARYSGAFSSFIVLNGPLTVGNAAAADGFATLGWINTSGHTLTLLDSNQAALGPVITMGSAISAGRIVAANGMVIGTGATVTGFGTLESPDDSARPIAHAGTIAGNSTTQRIAITGHLIGRGALTNVTINGTLSPGDPVSMVNYGSVTLAGRLVMELGGTTSGTQHDRMVFGSNVIFGGVLEFRLVNGFVPAIGQSFNVMSLSLVASGAFSQTIYPTLGGNSRWQVSGTPYERIIRVIDLGLFNLPESFAENAPPITVAVSRPAGSIADALTIDLVSSDPTELVVPASVTIPAGQTSVTFTATPVDDTLLDGDQSVTITGTASGFTGFVRTFTVEDYEELSITFASNSVVEGATVVGTVTRSNTDLDASLLVSLFGTHGLSFPTALVIPAGQPSATFNITPPDRNTIWTISPMIQATSIGYYDAFRTLTVLGSASLQMEFNQPIYEERQTPAYAVISRPLADADQDFALQLISNDTTEIVAVGGVIPAGRVSQRIDFSVRDDGIVDGLQTVTMTLSMQGSFAVTQTIGVTDSPVVSVSSHFSTVRETAGNIEGIVSRGNLTGTINVSLQSNNPKVQVPSSVTIATGTSFAIFPIKIVDNALLDGTVVAEITPTLTGYTATSGKVTVLDDERLTLTTAKSSVQETNDSTTVTLTRSNTDISQPLFVELAASKLLVPTSIFIPAGQSSVTFTANANGSIFQTGSQTGVITATATGYVSGRAEVTVLDDEVMTLTINRGSVSERGGTALGTITLPFIDSVNSTVVWLTTNDVTELILPDRVVIRPGQSSATFPVLAKDDALVDGTQAVTITAMSSPYPNASVTLTVTDAEPLTLTLLPTAISEGSSSTATVKRTVLDTSQPMTVNIASSDPTQVSVPATIVIPAGQTTATFTINALNDDLIDGTQSIRIFVSSPDAEDAFSDLTVLDAEGLSLTVAPATMNERNGTSVGTVSRGTTVLSQSVTVALISSDVSEATVPASVTIPAGQESTTFTITAVDDTLLDGTQSVTITASAPGFIAASSTITVADAEQVTVTAVQTSVAENAGQVTLTIARSNTDTGNPLTVLLSSSDTSELVVPANVTIAADASSVTVIATIIDDSLLDGPQSVTITATSGGYEPGNLTIIVTDYESLSLAPALAVFRENDGSIAATLTRSNTDIAAELTVDLASSATSVVTVPATIKIPAGQSSVAFPVTIIDDALLDGDQTVSVTATAAGYVSAVANYTITDYETLTLSFARDSLLENGETTTATVTRGNTDIAQALTVTLSSSDTTEATVPTSVIIPAGQSSVAFTLTAVDDNLLDGDQSPVISASATGYIPTTKTITIKDYETFELSIDTASISEKGGTTSGIVRRSNTDIAQALSVVLTSSDTSEATVTSVTIPAGQASTSFTINAVDDNLLDGTQTVSIRSAAAGYQDALASLAVTDFETVTLSLAASQISENGGATTGTVTRSNSDNGSALVVQLASNDTTEANLPASVTIPAGAASVTFTISAVDDSLLDGDQPVTLSATAEGYMPGAIDILVTDYETLTITLTRDNLFENGETTTATVRRNNTDLAQPLVVNFSSSDTTELSVPASVTIPAGQATASIILTAVDDTLLDGDQTAVLTAVAAGYSAHQQSVLIKDYETLAISLAVTTISEQGGQTTGSIQRQNTDITQPLTIQLVSSDTSEAVADPITIPAGQSSVAFTIRAVDDALLDGTQTAIIRTVAAGYQETSVTLQVTDAESITLNLANNVISEKGGSTTARSRAATAITPARWWFSSLAAIPPRQSYRRQLPFLADSLRSASRSTRSMTCCSTARRQ